MTSIPKNVYTDKLDNVVNKYNSTYHSTIKMKPVDVKPSTYIDSGIKSNYKNSKFKVSDHVTISKYEKGFVLNCSEKVFVIKKVKNIVSWTYVIEHINGEDIIGTFYQKNSKKQM